jgi:hypothetical protein
MPGQEGRRPLERADSLCTQWQQEPFFLGFLAVLAPLAGGLAPGLVAAGLAPGLGAACFAAVSACDAAVAACASAVAAEALGFAAEAPGFVPEGTPGATGQDICC